MNRGKAIETARRKRGLSIEELATKADIGKNTLLQMEQGQINVGNTDMATIAVCLNVPLPVLLIMSLEVEDVADRKKPAFRTLAPSLESLTDLFFE